MHVVASPAFHPSVGNPYITQLYDGLQRRGHRIDGCPPRSAVLRGRADIWHLHWPDYEVKAGRSAEAAARVAVLLGLVRLAKRRGTHIVWTAHNTGSHEGRHPLVERLLWRQFTRSVDGVIALSEAGAELTRQVHPALANKPLVVIPHGHYRDAYPAPIDKKAARAKLALPTSGRVVLHLGRIRPYKNVPALIKTFAAAGLDDTTLVIAGSPIDDALRQEITEVAHGTRDVVLRLAFIAEDDVPLYFSACDLVALPFTEINNSGSAILALSFNRPVIVPHKGALRELARLYGPEWVRTYPDELTPDVLRRLATEPAGDAGEIGLPELAWPTIIDQTEAFYLQLLGQSAPATPAPPNPSPVS